MPRTAEPLTDVSDSLPETSGPNNRRPAVTRAAGVGLLVVVAVALIVLHPPKSTTISATAGPLSSAEVARAASDTGVPGATIAVLSFWQAAQRGDARRAYNLLSGTARSLQPYGAFTRQVASAAAVFARHPTVASEKRSGRAVAVVLITGRAGVLRGDAVRLTFVAIDTAAGWRLSATDQATPAGGTRRTSRGSRGTRRRRVTASGRRRSAGRTGP